MSSKLQKLINNLLSNHVYVAEICDEYIKDEGCKIICDKLGVMDSIHTINFRGNDIQEIGAKSIVELVQRNKNIINLKLEWNLLGLQNAISVLCDGILLTSICHLDLRNNKIDSNGGKIISKMLIQNKTLNHLDLRWNNLGAIGGEGILKGLCNSNHDTLTECLLNGNQIPIQILRSIDDKLNKNKENKQSKMNEIMSVSELEINSNDSIQNSIQNTVENEIDNNDETIQTLQEEVNHLFGENIDLKSKYDELEIAHSNITNEYNNLQNEKTKLENKINKYETDTKELKNKIKELEESVNVVSDDKIQLENSHKIELNNLQKIINELNIEINELKTSNNKLKSETLENEILMEKKCMEFEKNIRNECNDTLNVKINDLEKNINLIKKSRDDLEFEMKSEKNKYSQLIQQIETEKNQYQNWLNDEQKAKSNLENQNTKLLINIQKYTNVITQKNQQIESVKIGLTETKRSIEKLQNENQLNIKEILSEHSKQILILEKSLRENDKQLTMSDHRNRNLQLELLKLKDEQQRKIIAVHDALKCLTNVYNSYSNTMPQNYVIQNKENNVPKTDNVIQSIQNTIQYKEKFEKTEQNVVQNKEDVDRNDDIMKFLSQTTDAGAITSGSNNYGTYTYNDPKSPIGGEEIDEDIDEDDEETIIEIIDDDDDDDIDQYSIDEYSVDEF